MPLTEKGEKIMAEMVKEYGEEKAKEVFYASKNAGKITGVDEEAIPDNIKQHFYITSHLSENIAETPEGYLLCTSVPVTRIGEFLYKGNELIGEDGKSLVEASADGVVRIQRDEDQVFSPTAIASLLGKSLTMDHPDGFVGPENWQKLTHGIVQNVRRGDNGNGDFLLADILVTTEEAIKAIKDGQRELSLGYDAQYEDTGGGMGKQKDLIFNHCALVAKGRAGSRCRISDDVKACTGCGKCTCGDKNNIGQEEDMTVKEFKSRFMKFFDSLEDETEEEKAARLAKEKEATDKKTKDQSEEEEAAKKRAEEEEAAKTKDQDASIADLEARLKRIEDMLAELLSEEAETGDEDPLPLEIKDEDGEEEAKKKEEEVKKKEAEDAEEEEIKAAEEKEEEEKKTTDAAWPELISRADILVPGIRLSKPTKDHLKELDEIKIDVLKKAVSGGDKEVLSPLLGKKKFRMMTTDALDIAFVAASEMVATKRNEKIQVKDGAKLKVHDFASARSVAEINKANKDFYGEKIFVEKS